MIRAHIIKILLFTCEINLILTWSTKNVIFSATGETKFAITDTKLYVPVVTLSTQGNTKLLERLKFGFRKTVNWNKYQSKRSIDRQNPYLDYLIDPSFQGVNRFFALSFEDNAVRKPHTKHFLPAVEIKD